MNQVKPLITIDSKISLVNSPIIAGIYKITNKTDQKYYIGQSIDIYNRLLEHQWGKSAYKSAIDAAIKKYGEDNFIYEVLEICEVQDLLDRESYWAEEVYQGQCYAPFGYNLDRTGRGGQKINWVSQYNLDGEKLESYYSMRYAGRTVGVSGPAISQAVRNKGLCQGFLWALGLEDKIAPYVPPEFGTKIFAYNADKSIYKVFKNGIEAAAFFQISPNAISSYVNHKAGYVSCKGYYLAKEGEEPVIRERFLWQKNRQNTGKTVYQYDLTTKQFIREYNSLVEAIEAVKSSDTKSIRNCCKGIQNKAYNYIWSYLKYDVIPINYREINEKYWNETHSKEKEFD